MSPNRQRNARRPRGRSKYLPPTRAGDVLLIANTGAYGHAMSSRYNLREPAQECVL